MTLEQQRGDVLVASQIATIAESIQNSQQSVDQARNQLASEQKIKVYYAGRDPQAIEVLNNEYFLNEDRLTNLREVEASIEASNVNFETVVRTRAALEYTQEYNAQQKGLYDVSNDPITRLKWLLNL